MPGSTVLGLVPQWILRSCWCFKVNSHQACLCLINLSTTCPYGCSSGPRGHESASNHSPQYCSNMTMNCTIVSLQAYLDMALHRLARSSILVIYTSMLEFGSDSTDHFQLMQVWFSASEWLCKSVHLYKQSAALNQLCHNKSLLICSTDLA